MWTVKISIQWNFIEIKQSGYNKNIQGTCWEQVILANMSNINVNGILKNLTVDIVDQESCVFNSLLVGH